MRPLFTLLFAVVLAGCGLPHEAGDAVTSLAGIAPATTTRGTGAPENSAQCPPSFWEARERCAAAAPCVGEVKCWYPEAGDHLNSGERAPGLLMCFDTSGGVPDAGASEWRCGQ